MSWPSWKLVAILFFNVGYVLFRVNRSWSTCIPNVELVPSSKWFLLDTDLIYFINKDGVRIKYSTEVDMSLNEDTKLNQTLYVMALKIY